MRVPIGVSYREFFKPTHPDDLERAERAGRLHPAGGYDEILRFVHADGSTRRVHIRTFPVRNADGRVYRVLGIGQDVTSLERAEDALRASEKKLRALIEHATDIIAVLGADATLQYLSPAFEVVLGLTTSAWLGRPLSELVWPDDVPSALALFQQSLEQPGQVIQWELRIRHADGGWRWLEGTGTNQIEEVPVHLLITDVVMPKMNGHTLAARLSVLRPNVRVLYTSGYTANVIVNHGVLKKGGEFIAKPYSGEDLARRVRETPDKPASRSSGLIYRPKRRTRTSSVWRPAHEARTHRRRRGPSVCRGSRSIHGPSAGVRRRGRPRQPS